MLRSRKQFMHAFAQMIVNFNCNNQVSVTNITTLYTRVYVDPLISRPVYKSTRV